LAARREAFRKGERGATKRIFSHERPCSLLLRGPKEKLGIQFGADTYIREYLPVLVAVLISSILLEIAAAASCIVPKDKGRTHCVAASCLLVDCGHRSKHSPAESIF
jgi:hypothetical protein